MKTEIDGKGESVREGKTEKVREMPVVFSAHASTADAAPCSINTKKQEAM